MTLNLKGNINLMSSSEQDINQDFIFWVLVICHNYTFDLDI